MSGIVHGELRLVRAAGLALATIAFTLAGCTQAGDGLGTQSSAETTASPLISPEAVSPEAQTFVDAYADRYADPLAVYHAEVAYMEASGGRSSTIGDDYVASYVFENDTFYDGETSPLGFTVPRIPLETPVTIENSVIQFNEFIPVLDWTLNLIARNPTPQQIAVVQDEFVKYAGYGNPGADDLFDDLRAIVESHGSSAVYATNPGTLDESASIDDHSLFYYRNVVIDSLDESGNTRDYSTNFDLSVSVRIFDSAGEAGQVTAVHEDLQFSVIRSDFDPLDVGYVGIGAKP